MEDLDAPRVVPGSADDILRTLEAHGLHWDGVVEYQSRRTDLYARALTELASLGLTFECSCSRRELAGREATAYPGTCRGGPTRRGPTATRFRVDVTRSVRFQDRIQGPCEFALDRLGDVVVRRRDGHHAYQLAVVVDDGAQSVTDIVRGADLLDSTPWQIELQRALRLPHPSYAHLPLVVEPDGSKLGKSRRSVHADPGSAGASLTEVLRLMRQDPPPELAREPPPVILEWAIQHWDSVKLSRTPTVPASS
jgi:glutamyl-Q tRNA(Asp) synthetase